MPKPEPTWSSHESSESILKLIQSLVNAHSRARVGLERKKHINIEGEGEAE